MTTTARAIRAGTVSTNPGSIGPARTAPVIRRSTDSSISKADGSADWPRASVMTERESSGVGRCVEDGLTRILLSQVHGVWIDDATKPRSVGAEAPTLRRVTKRPFRRSSLGRDRLLAAGVLGGPAQREVGDLLPARLAGGEVRPAGELLVRGDGPGLTGL